MLSVPSAQHDFARIINRKKSRYQISKEALLNGRKITRQPDTDIHAGKEKCRQNDHDHSLYIIFLFHMISPYLSLFQCFYHNTIPEEDTIEILCNCSQITIVLLIFLSAKLYIAISTFFSYNKVCTHT